jgi:hypothetical protein
VDGGAAAIKVAAASVSFISGSALEWGATAFSAAKEMLIHSVRWASTSSTNYILWPGICLCATLLYTAAGGYAPILVSAAVVCIVALVLTRVARAAVSGAWKQLSGYIDAAFLGSQGAGTKQSTSGVKGGRQRQGGRRTLRRARGAGRRPQQEGNPSS